MVLNTGSKPAPETSLAHVLSSFTPALPNQDDIFFFNEFNKKKIDAILAGDPKLGLVNSLGGRPKILIPKGRKWAHRSQG